MTLLNEFQEVLQADPGRTNLVDRHIETGSANPVRLPPYRVPYTFRDAVEKELADILKAGILEPSTSEWAAPIVLVKKKDGTLRFCMDYRKLNSVSRVDPYPMPRIDELLDKLGKAKYLTTLYLARGYWQVPMSTQSKENSFYYTTGALSVHHHAFWTTRSTSNIPENDGSSDARGAGLLSSIS